MSLEIGGPWTSERVERLRELAASGISAAEIARQLGGGLTRSAVLGKVSRMKIALATGGTRRRRAENQAVLARAQGERDRRQAARPARVPTPASIVALRPAAPALAERLAADYRASPARRHAFDPAHAPAGARIVPLTELQRGQCKWPLYEDGPMLFCGCPVESLDAQGQPHRYCDAHRAVGIVPSPGPGR